ncbi:MAG: squalene/phytoene synthase family protein [Gammaproteobacteria bacterium]
MDRALAIAECRRRVARAGSDLYYATMFLPEEEKSRLISLHALAAELDAIPRAATDPGVARIKLAWWREEIARLAGGRPQHPIALALAASGASDRIEAKSMLAMAAACETWLDRPRLSDMAAVFEAHAQFEGLLWRESARTLGVDEAAALDCACRLGSVVGVIHTMQGLGGILPRGAARLPEDLLRARGLDAEAIRRGAHDEAIAAVATDMAAAVRAAMSEALAALQTPRRDRLLPLLILADVAGKTLEELQAEGFRLLERRVALTPLRKLWTAVATRRRERRLGHRG